MWANTADGTSGWRTVVRRSRQFLAGEAADIDERIVDVGDHPLALVVEINRCSAGNVRSLWVIGWLLRMRFNPQGFESVSASRRFY